MDPQAVFSSVESVTVYYNEEAATGFPESGFYAAMGLSAYNALMERRGLPLLHPEELPCRAPYSIVNGPAANRVIQVVGHVDSVRSSLLTAGLLLVLYGGYFLATCLGAWRAVRGQSGK